MQEEEKKWASQLIQKKKTFDKIEQLFMTKKKHSQKTRNRREFLQHDKGIYEKSIDNIALNDEKLKFLSLTSGTIQRCLLS